jgi:hypothetical protein
MQDYLILALTGVVLTMNVLGLCFTLYRTRRDLYRRDQAASEAAEHQHTK